MTKAPVGAGGGAPSSSGLSKVGVGVAGAAIGSAATLIGKVFQYAGVQDLLRNNPSVGIAVLAMLLALIVLVLGLAFSRPWITAACAVALVGASMAVWFLAPLGFDVAFQAEPDMQGAPALRIISATGSDVDLTWNKPQTYHAERAHRINLTAQPIKDYYAGQMANCISTLRAPADLKLAAAVAKGGY